MRSFKIYYEHLNPGNDYLWQTPNLRPKYPECKIWYTHQHFGKGPLGSFVADLSEQVGTSKRYTNHCVRVSGTNVITKSRKFNNKEVMDFASHKSVQSLTIYQCVSNVKKLELAKTLTDAIKNKQDQPETGPEPVATAPINAKTNVQNEAILPQNALLVLNKPNWDDIPDFDLLSMLADLEQNCSQQDAIVPQKSQMIKTLLYDLN